MRNDSICILIEERNYPQKHKLPTYALLVTRVRRKVMTLDWQEAIFAYSGGTGSVLGICPVQKRNWYAIFVDQRNGIFMCFFFA